MFKNNDKNLEVIYLKRKNLELMKKLLIKIQCISGRDNKYFGLKEENDALKNYNLELINESIIKVITIGNLKEEIKQLEKFIEEYCKEKGEFNLKEQEKAESLITYIELNINFFSSSRKDQSKKIIKILRDKLGELESIFYYKNFKLGNEELSFFSSLSTFLNTCEAYFIGAKELSYIIDNQQIERVKLDLLNLKYIIKYKVFEKHQDNIMDLTSIFYSMKINKCINEYYVFENFRREFEHLSKQNVVFKTFIIKRYFPGEIFGHLSKFINLKYDYQLLKFYGRYKYLYVFGSEQYNVYKIGVTLNSLPSRYFVAKEKFQRFYKSNDFKEIKIIENPNAYRLEQFLKQKFKKYKHRNFQSNEWFEFNNNGINYFTNQEYLSDHKFRVIYEFDINI
jgi:T5orf172 domain